MNPATKVILSGVFGNLGRHCIEAASRDNMRNFVVIAGGLEMPNHPQLGPYHLPWGETFPVMSLTRDGEIPREICDADLLIDASQPAVVSVANLEAAMSLEIPVVILSTGHDPNQMKHIYRAGKKLPCVLWDLPVVSSPEARTVAAHSAVAAALWLAKERPGAGVYKMSQIFQS